MITFLVLLILAAILLQFLSLRDGLNHVDFSYRASVKETEPGVPFSVDVDISNTWLLPLSYLGAELQFPKSFDLPQDAIVEESPFFNTLKFNTRLGSKQRVTASVPLSSSKRGLHHLTGALLNRGDFLGLYETGRRYDSRSSVLVFPKPMEDHELMETLGSLHGDMMARLFLIRDPILTSNCREYTGQEPMHTISWMQTARTGDLMVREFEPTRELSCSIILYHEGLGREDESLLDMCCSMARTTGEFLMDRGTVLHFFTNSGMSGFARNSVRHIKVGRQNSHDYLAMLASLLTHSSGSPDALIDRVLQDSRDSSAFILIAPEMTEKLEGIIRTLEQSSGSEVALLLAKDHIDNRAAGESAAGDPAAGESGESESGEEAKIIG